METVVRVVPRDDFTLELWFSTGDHRSAPIENMSL